MKVTTAGVAEDCGRASDRGQRLARDLPEAAQGETRGARRGGEAEDPGRAGRQVRPVRLRADERFAEGYVLSWDEAVLLYYRCRKVVLLELGPLVCHTGT